MLIRKSLDGASKEETESLLGKQEKEDEISLIEITSQTKPVAHQVKNDLLLDPSSWQEQLFLENEENNRKSIICVEGCVTGVLTTVCFLLAMATVPEEISQNAIENIVGKILWVAVPTALPVLSGIACAFFHNKHMLHQRENLANQFEPNIKPPL